MLTCYAGALATPPWELHFVIYHFEKQMSNRHFVLIILIYEKTLVRLVSICYMKSGIIIKNIIACSARTLREAVV